MKLALIASRSQLGSDIKKLLIKQKAELVELNRPEFDITKKSSLKSLIKLNPDVVINCAAFHRVDDIEDNASEAFKVNAIAQKNLAEICSEINCKLVYISTDYVFGLKNKRTPYKETDIPNPVNIYGSSKVAGEQVTRYACKKHFIVRVSGLFGVAGSAGKGGNFIETMIRLGKERGEVKVVNDQVLTPTFTKNIAENLLALVKTNKYGTFHMTSKGECNWYEFACEIFKQTKLEVKCTPVTSEEFPTRAIRPKYSVLKNNNLEKINLNKMNPWKKNLKLYLKEKKYI